MIMSAPVTNVEVVRLAQVSGGEGGPTGVGLGLGPGWGLGLGWGLGETGGGAG